MNKFKKKLCTILLSAFIVVNSYINSFANPLATIPISYELLMGLMGIGVAYGVSLPATDEQYWDYARSLRENLSLCDDEYLQTLEQDILDWEFEEKPPGEEKSKLKIPYDSILEQLFKNVGKEVSPSYQYVSDLLNPIPLNKTDIIYRDVPFPSYTSSSSWWNNSVSFGFTDSQGRSNILALSPGYSWGEKGLAYRISSGTTTINQGTGLVIPSDVRNLETLSLGIFSNNGKVCVSAKGSSQVFNLSAYAPSYLDISNKIPILKPSIPYVPKTPNVDLDNNIEVPEFPQITIPNIETLPGYEPGINPPFEVAKPVEPPVVPPVEPPVENSELPTDTEKPQVSELTDIQKLLQDIKNILINIYNKIPVLPNIKDSSPPSPSDNVSTIDSIGKFLEGIMDILKALLIPNDDYWSSKLNNLQSTVDSKFGQSNLSFIELLKVNELEIPDLSANIKGNEIVVFKNDFLVSSIDKIRPIIGGMVIILLGIFNFNQIYKFFSGRKFTDGGE